MGCDISLRSVFTEDVMNEALRKAGESNDPGKFYAEALATGGYFREAYNRYSLIAALGMDWNEDVGPLLNDKGELSIAGARHLLAELEVRPVSPAMVDDVCAGRSRLHPGVRVMQEQLGELAENAVPGPQEGDQAFFTDHLIKRRELLMALLRRSIELNEPLECSL
jgi:hypothetical protein